MSWWDRIVDWGAEAIGGYEDYEDIAGGVSAGQQLISDVDDFLESDTFGFIKKGAKAYGMLSGTIDAEGNRIKGAQQPFKQTQIYKAPRSYKGRKTAVGTTTLQRSQKTRTA
jgi:hypothetical protein